MSFYLSKTNHAFIAKCIQDKQKYKIINKKRKIHTLPSGGPTGGPNGPNNDNFIIMAGTICAYYLMKAIFYKK